MNQYTCTMGNDLHKDMHQLTIDDMAEVVRQVERLRNADMETVSGATHAPGDKMEYFAAMIVMEERGL